MTILKTVQQIGCLTNKRTWGLEEIGNAGICGSRLNILRKSIFMTWPCGLDL
jgi:hypothetical protein